MPILYYYNLTNNFLNLCSIGVKIGITTNPAQKYIYPTPQLLYLLRVRKHSKHLSFLTPLRNRSESLDQLLEM